MFPPDALPANPGVDIYQAFVPPDLFTLSLSLGDGRLFAVIGLTGFENVSVADGDLGVGNDALSLSGQGLATQAPPSGGPAVEIALVATVDFQFTDPTIIDLASFRPTLGFDPINLASAAGPLGSGSYSLADLNGQYSAFGNFNLNAFEIVDIAPVAAVPEPASVALIGLGMVGLAGLRRRRQNALVGA